MYGNFNFFWSRLSLSALFPGKHKAAERSGVWGLGHGNFRAKGFGGLWGFKGLGLGHISGTKMSLKLCQAPHEDPTGIAISELLAFLGVNNRDPTDPRTHCTRPDLQQ